jgi:hypothetical protein
MPIISTIRLSDAAKCSAKILFFLSIHCRLQSDCVWYDGARTRRYDPRQRHDPQSDGLPFAHVGAPYAVGAILAHELAHQHLAEQRLSYPDALENFVVA